MNTTPGQQENRAFCTNGQPLPIYYTTKSMYRWVRPDAVRIEATSDDEEVLALAFNHKQDRTLTVIMINNGAAAKSVTLQGSALPQFTVYRTSASQNCVELTGALSGNTIQLPAKSITTLYGTNYTVDVQMPHGVSLRPAAAARNVSNTSVLGLDGRLVVKPANGENGHVAAGVYCLRYGVANRAWLHMLVGAKER
jgi:hypothetical protein